MPFDGNGTFTPATSPGYPAIPGTPILADQFNNVVLDITQGLSNVVARDGQSPFTANIPAGTHYLTGLGKGILKDDSARLDQIQSGETNYMTVAGTGDIITGTVTPAFTAYIAGQRFVFIAGATNTTNVTLDINALGIKNITKSGTNPLIAGDIVSGSVVEVFYDGTQFQLQSPSTLSPGTIDSQLLAASSVYSRHLTPSDTGPSLINGYITAVPTSNDLVYSLKTNNAGISTISVTGGGSGYSAAPIVGFTGGGGSGAKATAVISGGAVISVTITDPGTGYTSAPTVSFTGGGGSGATATATFGDPSSVDPVIATFRNPTLTNGTFTTVKITAPVTLTIPNTATMGGFGNILETFWHVLFLDGSTVRIGVINLATPVPIGNDIIASSTTISTAADSAGVYYTNTAVSNCPMVVVGYLQNTQASAGVWATAPSKIQLAGGNNSLQPVGNLYSGFTTKSISAARTSLISGLSPLVKRITITFNSILTSSTSPIILDPYRTTTGTTSFQGTARSNNAAAVVQVQSTVGIQLRNITAAVDDYNGIIEIVYVRNTGAATQLYAWTGSGSLNSSNVSWNTNGFFNSTFGPITDIDITTIAGAATFTGNVSVYVEY